MIHYKKFSFASPPRTGSTWFLKACVEIGIGNDSHSKAKLHVPPPVGDTSYRVSIVRHPYDWLESYYYALEGGTIQVECVDVFVPYVRQAHTFRQFVSLYLRHLPGEVGKMFDFYRPNNVFRVEDLPWAAIEFFQSIGVPEKRTNRLRDLPVANARKIAQAKDRRLRTLILDAEESYCDRYDYSW